MRKIIVITALVSGLLAFAGQASFAYSISSHVKNAHVSSKPTMIYGGKDVHRSVMAVANESFGLSQETWVG